MSQHWPLLRDDQNPAGREAVLAFHLHRLGITGSDMVARTRLKVADMGMVRQGKLSVSGSYVADLAAGLGVAPGELDRALTDEEKAEWEFYRLSWRHRREVWLRARDLWRDYGKRDAWASRAMGVSAPYVCQSISGAREVSTLARPMAARLTTALNATEGPDVLVEGLEMVTAPALADEGWRVAAE